MRKERIELDKAFEIMCRSISVNKSDITKRCNLECFAIPRHLIIYALYNSGVQTVPISNLMSRHWASIRNSRRVAKNLVELYDRHREMYETILMSLAPYRIVYKNKAMFIHTDKRIAAKIIRLRDQKITFRQISKLTGVKECTVFGIYTRELRKRMA